MSGASKGSLGLCSLNNDILPTSLADDFLMFVTKSNQRMLFGTSNLKTCMIINGTGDVVVSNKLVASNSDVNYSIATAGVVRVNNSGALQNISISTGSNNSVDPLVLSTVVPLSKGGTGISTATGTTGQSNIVLSSNPTFTGTVTADVISANKAFGTFLGNTVLDSVTVPSFTWSTDSNTGMYRDSNTIIAFSVGGTQALKIQPGNISSSNANLSLHGDTRFITLEGTNSASGFATAAMNIKNNWSRERGIYFQDIDASRSNLIWHFGAKYNGGSANTRLGFYYDSNIVQEFNTVGNVGIGKTPTGFKLDVNGNMACRGITLYQAQV